MLVAMDRISTQKRSDIVFLVVRGGDGDGVVELLGQLVPLVDGGSRIYFPLFIIFAREVNQIAVSARHAVTPDKQRPQFQIDGDILIGDMIMAQCSKINLQNLPYLLLQIHPTGYLQSLVVFLLVDPCECQRNEPQNKNGTFHWICFYNKSGNNYS